MAAAPCLAVHGVHYTFQSLFCWIGDGGIKHTPDYLRELAFQSLFCWIGDGGGYSHCATIADLLFQSLFCWIGDGGLHVAR